MMMDIKTLELLADLLAHRMAKRNGTASTNYIKGFADGVVFCAHHPVPDSIEKLMGEKEPPVSKPDSIEKPTADPNGTEES